MMTFYDEQLHLYFEKIICVCEILFILIAIISSAAWVSLDCHSKVKVKCFHVVDRALISSTHWPCGHMTLE